MKGTGQRDFRRLTIRRKSIKRDKVTVVGYTNFIIITVNEVGTHTLRLTQILKILIIR